MLEIFLVFCVFISIVGLCLHHHNMVKKMHGSVDRDVYLLKEAATYSINASNTVSPILALVDVVKAVTILETIHARYGIVLATELTNIDTKDMYGTLVNQKQRILHDILHEHPDIVPDHPLNVHAGYGTIN